MTSSPSSSSAQLRYRSVLVTGGLGFIGCRLAKRLASSHTDLQVSVLDEATRPAATRELEALGNVRVFRGDVSCVDFLKLVIRTRGCDAVVHLAAVTDCRVDNSLEFTRVNTIGTHVLLEVCCNLKVPKFVLVSTDAVYGTIRREASAAAASGEGGERVRMVGAAAATEDAGPSRVLRENALLDPTSPYAAAHAAAEMMTRAYHTSYAMDCNVVRLSNVYGPSQPPPRAVPQFILAVLNNLPVPIHGNGSGERAYVHVDDAVSALAVVLARGAPGEIYNCTSTDARSACGLLDDVCDALGVEAGRVRRVHVRDRPFNDVRVAASGDKLKRLGWRQTIGWKEGLRDAVAWYAHDAERYWGKEQLEAMLRKVGSHATARDGGCDDADA